MPDSRLLSRLGGDGPGEYDTHGRIQEEVIDAASPCFGWLRGGRDAAPMLELRKKTGTIVALSYSWLRIATFDPSIGVVLEFNDKQVTLIGRNLNAEVRAGVRLFEGISRHRVMWIREASGAELMQSPGTACIVESIQW